MEGLTTLAVRIPASEYEVLDKLAKSLDEVIKDNGLSDQI